MDSNNPWLKTLVILGVIIAAFYLFGQIWALGARLSDVILIFFLAWLVAFALNPAVGFLMSWRAMPRVVAVFVVYATLLGVIVGVGLLAVPPAVQQFQDLGNEIPNLVNRAPSSVDRVQTWLDERSIPVNLKEFFEGQEFKSRAKDLGSLLAANAVDLAGNVLLIAFDVGLVLVLSIYMLIDGPRIIRGTIRMAPDRLREDLRLFFATVEHSFNNYIRSWLVLALLYVAGTAIIMSALGIPFALPASLFAGAVVMLPFVGDVLAIIPPLAIGLFTVSLTKVIIASVAFLILQQLVFHVIRPIFMGESVGIHPILVLGSFLVGAKVAGFWGAIFSVPIAAIIQSVVVLYYQRAVARSGDTLIFPSPLEDLPPEETTGAPEKKVGIR